LGQIKLKKNKNKYYPLAFALSAKLVGPKEYCFFFNVKWN